MKEREHHLQVVCVNWFRMTHKKDAMLLHAIPNGGQRNAIVAAKLKAEGVVSGIPDLHLPISKGGHHSLYIEMKAGAKGVVSANQKTMMALLEEQGNKCVVCRSFDDFKAAIEGYYSS